MATNIQQISEKRKKWIEANRENGFEDGIKRLLTDLYPDNAHFIYELLQNAEDAGASEVRFILNNERLEFEHNGDRLFSIKDIDSITSIGVSTKKDDPTSIGKFGVGFKAVFAYTAMPEIASGQFHFRIRDLVVPDTEGLSPCAHEEKETRFVFPFNNPRKPPERARAEIERNLRQLNESTLLFLRNIRKIEYLLPDSTLGFLERSESDGNQIEISVRHPEDSVPAPAVFLRFEKVVDVNDEDGKPKPCRIAVAYSMEKTQETDVENPSKQGSQHPNAQWKIKPLEPGRVSIFFPADKETSNLRFHLHASFASTVARDSVRDCSSNNELRDHLAQLIAESMAAIRDQGLLTVEFLSVLPTDKDNLPLFYKPIQNKLIETFREHELVPTDDNRYARAIHVFQGPAPLRKVILAEELSFFVGKDNVCWAKGVQKNLRVDHFLQALGIQQWSWEQLQTELNKRYGEHHNIIDENDVSWLAERDDSWLHELYILLADAIDNNACSEWILKHCRIIRVLEGGKETHVAGPRAYFPKGPKYKELPQIKRGILRGKNGQSTNKIQESLVGLGVSEIGDEQRIDLILETFYGEESAEITNQEHLQHMSTFIKWWKKEKNASKFEAYTIFWAEDKKLRKPDECYLDSPIHKSGLDIIYKSKNCNMPRKWKLWSGYRKLDGNDFCDFAKNCGVDDELTIEKQSCYEHPNVDALLKDLFNGAKSSNKKIDQDYTIKELQKLLKMKNIKVNLLIWHTVSKAKPEVLEACFQPNQKCETRPDKSSLVITLSKAEWIPDKRGHFHKPCEITKEQLHKDFKHDNRNGWLDAIGFGEEAKKRSEEYRTLNTQAKKLGFNSFEELNEVAKLKREDPEGYKKWRESNKEKPSFPKSAVSNPDRRQERLLEQFNDASEKEYEKRDRNVRITRGTVDPIIWLKNQYTNETGQMICQICKEEMPFRKRDGEYYFEKVEAFSREHFTREHEAQFLALCPLCAAMYKEFVKNDESAKKGLYLDLKNSEKPEVPLNLGKEKTSIRFVESHWRDMRTILQENG